MTDSSSYSFGDYHEANWDDLGHLGVHMSKGLIKHEGIELDMWVVVFFGDLRPYWEARSFVIVICLYVSPPDVHRSYLGDISIARQTVAGAGQRISGCTNMQVRLTIRRTC